MNLNLNSKVLFSAYRLHVTLTSKIEETVGLQLSDPRFSQFFEVYIHLHEVLSKTSKEKKKR